MGNWWISDSPARSATRERNELIDRAYKCGVTLGHHETPTENITRLVTALENALCTPTSQSFRASRRRRSIASFARKVQSGQLAF